MHFNNHISKKFCNLIIKLIAELSWPTNSTERYNRPCECHAQSVSLSQVVYFPEVYRVKVLLFRRTKYTFVIILERGTAPKLPEWAFQPPCWRAFPLLLDRQVLSSAHHSLFMKLPCTKMYVSLIEIVT